MANQQIIDLVGNLGRGVILDTYTNYHDSPNGEFLAVCEFQQGDETVICDRSFDDISLLTD